MSNKEINNNSAGGLTLSGALLIVFLVLKLTGVINWSWWWVLSPLWIPMVLLGAISLIIIIIESISKNYKKKR